MGRVPMLELERPGRYSWLDFAEESLSDKLVTRLLGFTDVRRY